MRIEKDVEMGLLMRAPFWALTLLLGACALTPQASAPALFDLGPAPTLASQAAARMQQVDVSAPPWLGGTGIAYRLTYQDAFRREVYRDSRWAAPPAVLLAERLRQRAAASSGPGAVILRLELEEFGQIFDTPTQSRVLLRVRAWSGDAPAVLKVFELNRPAPSADAAGAVQGLSRASDELIDLLLAWAAQK